MQHVLDPTAFRLAFPAFSSASEFPDAKLQANFGLAVGYLGDYDGCLLSGAGLQSALDFLTAHLLAVGVILERGQTAGVVTGSTIDKVQVQLTPPPIRSGWQYWLSTTPYGIQLWALLSVRSAGGFMVGGSLERAAFRKAGGWF